MTKKLEQLSLLEIHRALCERKISPSELLEAFIRNAEENNFKLNAITEKIYDRARRKAQQLSEKIAIDKTWQPDSVFWGVPYSVKEMIAIQDILRTGGSWHRREDRSEETATLVERLNNVDAIPFVTSNVPELGFWFETDNPVYGRTNNPYNPLHTSGGSSGGEGALVGSGSSVFGLGSDIGGSVRIPAAFCGVFGHKPSHRSLPLTGHFPYLNSDFQNMKGRNYPFTAMGFLSRSAKDLPYLMDLLKGPDGIDSETKEFNVSLLQKTKQNDLKNLTVYLLASPVIHGTSQTSAEVSQVVVDAAQALEQFGAKIIELPKNYFLKGKNAWMSAVRSTKQDRKYVDLLTAEEKKISWTKEIIGQVTGQSTYTIPSLVTVILEQMASQKTEEEHQHNFKIYQHMKADFQHMLGPQSILLCPPYPKVAPLHRHAYLTPFDFIYSGLFTVLETPATVVPMGLNKQGLPLSVQIVAPAFRDDLNFFIAEQLEAVFGGWTPAVST